MPLTLNVIAPVPRKPEAVRFMLVNALADETSEFKIIDCGNPMKFSLMLEVFAEYVTSPDLMTVTVQTPGF
jgi:hypothetical protein